MNISHDDMVRQLAKPGQDIINSITAGDAHLIHMLLGIMGEIAELGEALELEDDKNILEELGDLEFYVQGIYHWTGFSRRRVIPNPVIPSENGFSDMLYAGGSLLDVIKKLTIYRKPIGASDVLDKLTAFESALNTVYELTGFTRVQAWEANIAKLGERYQGHEYSDQQAQDRVDKDPEKNDPPLIPLS